MSNDFEKSSCWKKLLIHHGLDEEGVWEIRGECPNADFGGTHIEPYIATVRGTLQQAYNFAVSHQKFYVWGAGGSIKPVEILDIKDVSHHVLTLTNNIGQRKMIENAKIAGELAAQWRLGNPSHTTNFFQFGLGYLVEVFDEKGDFKGWIQKI